MAKNVNGQLAIMATAPMAHPTWPVCHHAASPSKKPKMANGACIAPFVCRLPLDQQRPLIQFQACGLLDDADGEHGA
jgi:hypothetical protein